MENCERQDSTNEFEVVEMLGVDTTVGVDLKRVVIVLVIGWMSVSFRYDRG